MLSDSLASKEDIWLNQNTCQRRITNCVRFNKEAGAKCLKKLFEITQF